MQKKPRSKCGVYGLLLLSRIRFLHQRRGCGGFIIVIIYGLLLLVLFLLLIRSSGFDVCSQISSAVA
jgi:hypothetical protein